MREQTERVSQIVDYQFATRRYLEAPTLMTPIAITQPAATLIDSLEKVYAERQLRC